MSIPLHSITTRSSSSSPTREEIDHEYLPQEDTAGLTADVTRIATATTQQSIFTRIFSETWTSEILCWLLALLSLVIIIIEPCSIPWSTSRKLALSPHSQYLD